MLLCAKHHTLLHEGGFRIETDFQGSWYFVRPDGIAVPATGYHARDMIDIEHYGKLCEGSAGACLFTLAQHCSKYLSA